MGRWDAGRWDVLVLCAEIIWRFLCAYWNNPYYCIRIVIIDNIMCTFNITIDDSLLERVRPAFASDDALRLWVTDRVKAMLQNYSETLPAIPCSYAEEEAYSIVKNRLQKLEDGAAELIDGDDCLSEIRTRYGIEA